MAEILLFHHVQGLTSGISSFADRLRESGHTVHAPDLFDGHTFPTLDEGIDYARSLGFGSIVEQAVGEAEALKPDLVYAGVSMGVMAAQQLAQTRPGAKGALFIASCLPVTEFGDSWPDDVPAQVHGMDADPEFVDSGDLDEARALVESTEQAELFLYPGDAHLFLDSSLPSHDKEATELMTNRILDFLATV